MVLFRDYSVVVELHESSNIICVRWLELQVFSLSEFELTFMDIMDNIEKYGVKKLLANPSKTLIYQPDEIYKKVISILQSGFAHSCIEKVARIYVDKSARDLECIAYFKEMLNEMQLEIEFQNFDDRRSAMAWLQES